MSAVDERKQPGRDQHVVFWRLFLAALLTTLSKAAAIMVAKSFNSAVAQSISPRSACAEHPAADWQAFGYQLLSSFVLAHLVLRAWFKLAHKTKSRLAGTKAFILGEILGWSLKEVTAVGLAILAQQGLGYRLEEEEEEEAGSGGDEAENGGSEDGRRLRDYLQGDAPLNETSNDWTLVAAHAIYAALLTLVAVLLFGVALRWVERAVDAQYRFLYYRVPYPVGIRPVRSTLRHPETGAHLRKEPLEEEETKRIAGELATESLKISHAYAINGALCGMIHIGIREMSDADQDLSYGSFGLLEVYAISMMFVGGLAFQERCLQHETLAPLFEFFKDVWTCLAGFALGSIATSPGGVLSGLTETSAQSELAHLAIKASIISAIAISWLLKGCHVRMKRRLCCVPVGEEIGETTAAFITSAAALAFAWAWEEFSNDLTCKVFAEDGFTEGWVVWLYSAIVIAVMIPVSLVLGEWAEVREENVEEDLRVLFGDSTHKQQGEEEEEEVPARVQRTSEEDSVPGVEDIETTVDC